jgi:mono/diheme cytochrome c family protein
LILLNDAVHTLGNRRHERRSGVPVRALAWVIAALLALGQADAIAQEFGDAQAGRDFAREVCAACHEVEGEDVGSPHPDAPTFRRIANVPGMTATALLVILRTPHRQMPDLVLTPDEMRDVAAYILTLKQDN